MFSETTGWHCCVSTHPVDGARTPGIVYSGCSFIFVCVLANRAAINFFVV